MSIITVERYWAYITFFSVCFGLLVGAAYYGIRINSDLPERRKWIEAATIVLLTMLLFALFVVTTCHGPGTD